MAALDKTAVEIGAGSKTAFSDCTNPAVLRAAALGIVNGYGDGTFRPDRSISRKEAACMLARAADVLGIHVTDSTKSFTDSYEFVWAWEAIEVVSNTQSAKSGKAIMGGVSETLFSPNSTYTVEQAAISVLRLTEVGAAARLPEPDRIVWQRDGLTSYFYPEQDAFARLYQLSLERVSGIVKTTATAEAAGDEDCLIFDYPAGNGFEPGTIRIPLTGAVLRYTNINRESTAYIGVGDAAETARYLATLTPAISWRLGELKTVPCPSDSFTKTWALNGEGVQIRGAITTRDEARENLYLLLDAVLSAFGASWYREGDLLYLACTYMGGNTPWWEEPYLCAINTKTGDALGESGVVFEHPSGAAIDSVDGLLVPLGWLETLFSFELTDGAVALIADRGGFALPSAISCTTGEELPYPWQEDTDLPDRFTLADTFCLPERGETIDVMTDGAVNVLIGHCEESAYIIGIDLISDAYETCEGLRVGDTVAKFWERYPYKMRGYGSYMTWRTADAGFTSLDGPHCGYEAENGIITKIWIRSVKYDDVGTSSREESA